MWTKVTRDHPFVSEDYGCAAVVSPSAGPWCPECGDRATTVCTRCFAEAINAKWKIREEVYATKLADAITERNNAVRIKEAEKLILLEEIQNHTATREKLAAALDPVANAFAAVTVCSKMILVAALKNLPEDVDAWTTDDKLIAQNLVCQFLDHSK